MTHDKPHSSEGSGLNNQLPDRLHHDAADLSGFGMGTISDFNRHLVLPLQSDFSREVPRHDGSGDLLGATGEPLLHRTLHGQLLFLFLVLAASLRPVLDKWNLLSDTLRSVYR